MPTLKFEGFVEWLAEDMDDWAELKAGVGQVVQICLTTAWLRLTRVVINLCDHEWSLNVWAKGVSTFPRAQKKI